MREFHISIKSMALVLALVLAVPLSGCNASTPTPTPTSLFLTIVAPANETIVDVNTVTIQGQTLADAMVSINGESVAVDSSGNFSLPVTLEEGPNVFDIIASDQAGDQATAQLIVYYAP
ncbi:MAG TPA: hypothetical protein VEG28_00470 [Dehalococcoidia bacterium]|nr:hypothetical protein [Dehalococcoidia bacterium]